MTVTVNAATTNAAPTVSAGPDRIITLPSTATLQGSASDDGKPSPPGAMTLRWTRVSGPGTVTFSDSCGGGDERQLQRGWNVRSATDRVGQCR